MPLPKIVKCIKETKDMWSDYVIKERTLCKAKVCNGVWMYKINDGYYYPSWFTDATLLEQLQYYNNRRKYVSVNQGKL